MMLLASAQLLVMLGLLRLSELAWYTALAVYAITGLVHLSQSNHVGVGFALGVMLYLRYEKALFTA
jgi:hypothetical protein